MIRIGIDPGIAGAISVFENDRLINIFDLPTVREKSKKRLDPAALGVLLRRLEPRGAILERVNAMPKQGVTSMFSFGRTLGVIEGCLGALEIPVTLVSPVVWKGALKVPKDKHAARARASQLLPYAAGWWPLEKHHGRAESALIGLYGLTVP